MKTQEQHERAELFTPEKTQLKEALTPHKLSEEDYENILAILGRSPTLAELGVFSAMWSEHCSYKSSKIHLKTLPTEGPHVVMGPGENAGIIRMKDKLCLAFKMESHNHPSFIEPYQGAATGVGGILRDVFCMGARPVALLDALRFGEKDHPKTPWLVEHVVKGIGDYGNCIGIPTVAGSTSFDKRYNGNILVNAMAAGVIHEDKIFTGKAAGLGNLIYYVGAATGRDGIHGATMASASFDSEKDEEKSAVQVGDPFFEKLLMEATLEVLEKNLVVGLQDMGAAGLTSSLFEMASRGEAGVFLDLEKVPTRTEGMTPYELMLSESQERMLMVIEPENKEALEAVFEKWDLAYDQIGFITGTNKVEAYFGEKLHLDIPVDPLVEKAPLYDRPQEPRSYESDKEQITDWEEKVLNLNLEELITKLCSQKIAHKELFEQYDHEVGLRTVLSETSEGASVLELYEPSISPEKVGVALTANCLEHYCEINPKEGAKHTVYKTARTLIASGAEPLAITDCLNYGNPEDPKVMWTFAEGIKGIKEACFELESPVVSGNVSLYNETNSLSILPTPMIGMVGKIDDAIKAKPACFKKEASVYLVCYKENPSHLIGSNLSEVLNLEKPGETLPKINQEAEQESKEFILNLSRHSEVKAIKDTDRAGALVSLVKMTQFQNKIETFCKKKEDLGFYLTGLVGAYLVAIDKSFEKELKTKGQKLNKNQIIKVADISENDVASVNLMNQKISLESLKNFQQAQTQKLF